MRSRWWRTAVGTVLLGAGMVVAGWLVIVLLPQWALGADVTRLSPMERITALSTARGQAITAVSGIGALVLVTVAMDKHFLEKDKQRLDRDKQRLDVDKHLTGQFDAAMGRLIAEHPRARAGGVRTLARLVAVSEVDHMLGIASLCDLLRELAVPQSTTPQRLGDDLVAAVAALRERPARPESAPLDLAGVFLPGSDWRDARIRGVRFSDTGTHADLGGADFTRADLTEALCRGVRLTGAVLHETILTRTDLSDADLADVDLTEAKAEDITLTNAVLTGADLRGANLRGAMLRRARMRGARIGETNGVRTDLTGTNLDEADLTGTDLSAAQGLTDNAVRTAIVDSETKLPPGVHHPRLRPDRPR
ncbi:pentapeptide repeat-containing protein [Nocardia sp. CA-128927]|uniref:pentapeptide repeat-containing protein n=1 Tax=Nocardia sp. CA-128927 TaxID=3239975 RepID=UPI003D965E8E